MVADGVIYGNRARVKNLARINDYDRVDQGTSIDGDSSRFLNNVWEIKYCQAITYSVICYKIHINVA